MSVLRFLGHQTWLRFGLRDRILRYLDPPGGASRPFDIEFFGLRYEGDRANYIDWSVYYYGGYELGTLALLRDLAAMQTGRKDWSFLDVGANCGQHSLFMSRLAPQVLAVEAFPPLAQRIEAAVKKNALGNVDVANLGLAAKAKQLPFFAPAKENLGVGTFSAQGAYDDDKKEAGLLSLVRGDDLVRDRALAAPRLIKIDVEGFEAEVLLGLKETIEKNYSMIVCEWRFSLGSPYDFLPENYTVYRIGSHQPHSYFIYSDAALSEGKVPSDGVADLLFVSRLIEMDVPEAGSLLPSA